MKRSLICLLYLVVHAGVYADAAPSVNPKATENMVFLSAYAQGKWEDVNPQSLEETTCVVALDYTLKLIAVAQETARTHGEEILLKLKDFPDRYCELAYSYAKLSNCPIPVKTRLLKEVLERSNDQRDPLLPALAAFELLKHHRLMKSDDIKKITDLLSSALMEYKVAEISTNRYWRLLDEIGHLITIDPAFQALVQSNLSDELRADIQQANVNIVEDPNYFGLRLYHHDMYDAISDKVREFWCNTWRCDGSAEKVFQQDVP